MHAKFDDFFHKICFVVGYFLASVVHNWISLDRKLCRSGIFQAGQFIFEYGMEIYNKALSFFFLGEYCCANKTVGDVKYYLESKDLSRTKYFGCKDVCIYRR
jgi:hypothetical protein